MPLKLTWRATMYVGVLGPPGGEDMGCWGSQASCSLNDGTSRGAVGFLERQERLEFGPEIIGDAPDRTETSLRLVLRFHGRQPLLR